MVTRIRPTGRTVLSLCAAMAIAFTIAAVANIDGAIFTTTSDGTTVNGNIYASKADVYLNGGPQNQSANGLPDGTYYFQVTDPSGSQLLSTDAIGCRELQVVGGRVSGAAGSCPHANGTTDAANQTTPVQLIPFDNTLNNGGEYKVWLTLVDDYDAEKCEGTPQGAFGFCDSNSKTDNFKVQRAQQCPRGDEQCQIGKDAYLTVCKFWDQDQNGTHGGGEPLLGGWAITASATLTGDTTQYTDAAGASLGCTKFNLGPYFQTVTLTEGHRAGWARSAPIDGTYSGVFTASNGATTIDINPGDDLIAPDFGNHCDGCASPTANKDASGSYKKAYTWTIAKAVDKTEVKQSATSATFTYTVTVTHDAGTVSDVTVSGAITIGNRNTFAVTIDGVTDKLSDGTVCSVTNGETQSIAANSSSTLSYECGLGGLPDSLDNTATITWSDDESHGLVGGSATSTVTNISFVKTDIDGTVSVTDTVGGLLGTVSAAGDPNPATFTYPRAVIVAPGYCQSFDNTATFVATTTGATGADGKTVRLCVGADLTVAKTATASNSSNISKSVDKTLVEQAGGTATFNYTVKVTESGWTVSGNITVRNPNTWESITVNGLSDALSVAGGNCTVNGGNPIGTVAASSSVIVPYSCTYSSAPAAASGTNTATASWNSAAAYTPGGFGSGSAGFAFPSLAVTDTFKGVLGTIGGNVASTTFGYARTVSAPAGGTCQRYDNTAAITQTGQTASQSVNVCNTATGALTMGFWQNKNGQGIITGGALTSGVCNSGAWLRQYAPFQDLSATANCAAVGTYVTNIIKSANSSGAAMNAMLKGQMLATALDVYFSNSALGGNKINAAQALGGVKIDLTKVCKMIDNSSTGSGSCSGITVNASSAFGGATALTVSQLLAYAASQSNAGGSTWYANVKATQELAKNTFDEINNQVAQIAP